MAGGRPCKLTEETQTKIVERLQAGCTRKASAESAGVSYDAFNDWLKRGGEESTGKFCQFLQAVTRAEADAEVRMALLLKKAASGWDSLQTTRQVKTVVEIRKTKYTDGTVLEEPITLELVTETTVEATEFDWRAAESWLKRRRKDEWGEKLQQDITSNGETLAPNIEIALAKVYGNGEGGGGEQ